MAGEINRLREVPTAEAYAFALSQASVRDDLRRTLSLHAKAPQAELACSTLSRVSGLSIPRLNSAYGVLGREIKEILSLDVPAYSESDQRLLVASVLVQISRKTSRSPWAWRLYPEVCAAIDEFGWTDA